MDRRKNEKFFIGCNYWASNSGTEMWRKWDCDAINEDLKILSSHGITHLRVFPNWRDFQPIIPMMQACGSIKEYRLENEAFPANKYYIDETMLNRFSEFCDICDKYNIKLIVGLITGWMSGRLFVPPALYEKNLYTDPTALLFEQKFITGFVRKFKNRKTIYAWDLGNECNCMSYGADRNVAANWTSIISNTIKANDTTRPIVSGMHGLSVDNTGWTIHDQAEFTDILTTHPYPFWIKHADKDEIGTFRTSIHAAYQTKLYSDIGGRSCFAEEIGTMGPMVCSDEKAGDFLRCNLFSNFANGSSGVMWWCANDQTNLTTAPYTWNMVEVELGMLDVNKKPKPVLNETKKFADFLSEFDTELQKPLDDAVCILTQSQDQNGISYMSYCLAKQNDINLKFVYCEQDIPKADVYMLPCVTGITVMPAENYNIIKERIYNGAKLYISIDDGVLSEFNALTGNKVIDSSFVNEEDSIKLDGEIIKFMRNKRYRIETNGADVLACDSKGNPGITEFKYGKGKVFFVNFPLEKMLLDESNAFDTNRYLIYNKFFENEISKKTIISKNKYIAVTEHKEENETFCIAINHSSSEQNTMLELKGCKIKRVIYGDIDVLKPFDAVVFSVEHV